jgi:hypothetical protein
MRVHLNQKRNTIIVINYYCLLFMNCESINTFFIFVMILVASERMIKLYIIDIKKYLIRQRKYQCIEKITLFDMYTST